MEQVRVDKWLWAARCFKTRSQATGACNAGHVEINGIRAKPSARLAPGDRVEVLVPAGHLRVLLVKALAQRRASATAAAVLFDDLTPPPPPREEPPVWRERGSGRPTKRDRRMLDRLLDDDF